MELGVCVGSSVAVGTACGTRLLSQSEIQVYAHASEYRFQECSLELPLLQLGRHCHEICHPAIRITCIPHPMCLIRLVERRTDTRTVDLGGPSERFLELCCRQIIYQMAAWKCIGMCSCTRYDWDHCPCGLGFCFTQKIQFCNLCQIHTVGTFDWSPFLVVRASHSAWFHSVGAGS